MAARLPAVSTRLAEMISGVRLKIFSASSLVISVRYGQTACHSHRGRVDGLNFLPYARRGACAKIAARDITEWLVPIGAEGLLPGANNRDQSVLGQMGLVYLGIGSHQYNNKQQAVHPATSISHK
jgi:hypothetical protein